MKLFELTPSPIKWNSPWIRRLMLQHFADEEVLMLQIGYPLISGHKWHHDVLPADLNRIKAIFVLAERRLTGQELATLRAITIDQTGSADADFIQYYEERGESLYRA